MFGKSLAESAQLHFREFHLNFVKQRRNTCKRPNASQNFRASAKQAYKCTATLLEPQYNDTSEARVGGQGLKSKLRATRTSSRMLLKHLECFSAHHAHSKHLTSSSKQEALSSQAPNMLCPCLFLPKQNKRFKHSSQLTQSKLVVHVTCARHPVNCKGTHKKVKNFHTYRAEVNFCLHLACRNACALALASVSTGLEERIQALKALSFQLSNKETLLSGPCT